MNPTLQFLTEIIGEDGAKALQKAAVSSQELGNAITPRAILAWIKSTPESFVGDLPGCVSPCHFFKSEFGYDGSVMINSQPYEFEHASIFHLTACVSMALGIKAEPLSKKLKDLDIEALGKSIDLLVRTKKARKQLEKTGPEAPTPPTAPTALAPAPAATKVPAPAAVKPKVAKLPSAYSVKVTKSEALCECPVCGGKQFKTGEFVGCLCFTSMAKSVTATNNVDGGFTLEFQPDFERDAILTLLEAMGRE